MATSLTPTTACCATPTPSSARRPRGAGVTGRSQSCRRRPHRTPGTSGLSSGMARHRHPLRQIRPHLPRRRPPRRINPAHPQQKIERHALTGLRPSPPSHVVAGSGFRAGERMNLRPAWPTAATRYAYVREQVLGRVGGQVDLRLARVRRAPAAAALVEQDDPVHAEHGTIVIESLRRRRDAPQPAPRPPRRLCRLGRTPTPDRVQHRLCRWPRRGRGPLVSLLHNVFGMWCGESQAAPSRTHLPLRAVRSRAGS
jgi:hypothetical protein